MRSGFFLLFIFYSYSIYFLLIVKLGYYFLFIYHSYFISFLFLCFGIDNDVGILFIFSFLFHFFFLFSFGIDNEVGIFLFLFYFFLFFYFLIGIASTTMANKWILAIIMTQLSYREEDRSGC